MFAGRSTKSLKCFKKTAAPSPVLHALLACVFLIVLDIDVTWSMSLDKLALERNEILESQPDSSVSESDIGSAPILVDDMKLEAVPVQGNTDLFVLLPANHDDGIDRNTIDVGAEGGSDMLMMETNEEPAREIVAVAPAEAITEEFKKDEEEEQNQLTAVEEPEKVSAEVANAPIAMLLAEHAQQQQESQMEEELKSEVAGNTQEQNKMAEIPELIEDQQHQDAIKFEAAEKPLQVNIPVDAVEDLGNALETEIAENAESEPIGETKLQLTIEELNNNLEMENVEAEAQQIDDSLNIPAEQHQKIVPENMPKDNIENEADVEPATSAEKATIQDIIGSIQDVLESQQVTKSDSEKKLENLPQEETTENSLQNDKAPSDNLNEKAEIQIIQQEEQKGVIENAAQAIFDEEEQNQEQNEEQTMGEEPKEVVPNEDDINKEEPKKEEPQKEESKEDEAKDELKEAEPNQEQPKQEEPKEDEQKEGEPKEEKPKEENPKEEKPKEDINRENSLEKEPAEEEQNQELAQEEKVDLDQNMEEPVKIEPMEIELKGELPKTDEVEEEQEKVEEQQLDGFNEADYMTAEEAHVLEDETNGENKQELLEESPVEQNNEVKISNEEIQINEHLQEEQTNEQQNVAEQLYEEQNQQEQNLEEINNEEENQNEKQSEEEQALVDPIMGEPVQEEKNEEQHILEEPLEEHHYIEGQKADEINKDNSVPTIEVVAPTNNNMEALNIVEEVPNTSVTSEVSHPDPAETTIQQHTNNEVTLEQEEYHDVDKNEDKAMFEIPEEIKDEAVEEQLMPVNLPTAESVDEMTIKKEEEQQETEIQTEEIAAEMQHGTELVDAAAEEVQEVAVQTNPDETIPIDEDKTQIAHEEEKETENHEANSMLTTIVQVPTQLQLELLPPVQDEQQLDLLSSVQQDEVKTEEKDDQVTQIPVESVAIVEPAAQVQQEEAVPAIKPQELQQQPTQVSIEPATQKPLNVMDSVLNYVNATFTINNNNNQNQQQQQLDQQDNDDDYSAQLRRYDGAQVWRIVVQNDKDKKLADELQTKYDGQLWKEVKQEVDYLLKPQVLADAARHIRAANLSRIVLIDNLQKVIEVENPPADEIAQLQNRKGHRLTWQAYHRLEDIHGFFDYLAKTYPDICSVETIGYSLQKRPLKILKISNGKASNPGIWMDGGMHAREWISPASVTYVANQLVEGWDDLPDNMRNINWYIHAVANPDGYEYTHTTDRLWRKNMRSHGRQCPGVDLNRNFGYKWGGKGTSANPCSQTYRGSKAFSEPETFYISKFISNFPRETFQAYLSFHSYGQYILYPWGFDYQVTKDRADLDRVARQAGTIITKSSGVKYTVGSSATTLYPAAGGSDDWAKGIAGIKYSYTIEMGDTGRYGFVLPASMIESNAQDAYTFVETVASAVTNPEKWSRKRAI